MSDEHDEHQMIIENICSTSNAQKKVLKIVGETKDGPVPIKPTLLSWYVNEFRVARRKLLLFTNDLTYLGKSQKG